MGPKIIKKVSKKTDIAYSIRLLPIGGYVSMVGEDEESDSPDALCNKPVWQRMIITAAGSLSNIITGIILMLIVVIFSSALGSNEVSHFSDGAISSGYGLMEGDIIKSIDGSATPTWRNLVYEIGHSGAEPVDIKVIRDGSTLVLEDVCFGTELSDGITFGVVDFMPTILPKNFVNVISHTFHSSVLSIKMIWESLIDMITGKYGIDAVSGPVGVTTTIGDAVKQGFVSLCYLCSFLAMNLGVFNLLPIPALDGGRLFFQTVELILRKPINRKYEGIIHFVGIVLLMTLMVFVTFKDIIKLIAG